MPGQFEREPLDVGFTMVPHGLWTLDVPPGARCLLGWLHSHTDDYLAHLTLNGCREAFRTSSVADWLGLLERAGFIEVIRPAVPKRATRFRLLAKPWQSLDRQSVSRNRTSDWKAETGLPGKPKPARVVDQEEEQNPPTPHDNSEAALTGKGGEVIETMMRQAREQSGPVSNRARWEDAVRGRLVAEYATRVEKLVAECPQAPADVIASYLVDGTNTLRFYRTDDGLTAPLAHMDPEARKAYEDAPPHLHSVGDQ